ncbi:MAG: peptidylprolyl isomerase [Acidobacteriota bacterium]|nr:MAG: peptidylprolyl isomerase [Acidobacteriota bacterium]
MAKNGLIQALFLTGLVAMFGSCSTAPETQPAEETAEALPAEEAPPSGPPTAIIETDKGEITIELLPDIAPETVRNFLELAEVGFYNQTSFHRVIKGQMIQGGDPYSRDRDPYNDGQGSSGAMLPQEFSDHAFDRGTVAMGRSPGGDDGGSCQFFIALKRAPSWDGQYNAFGRVIEGIEVAEEIADAPLSKDTHPSMKNRPAGKQTIKRIRVEYR